MAFLSILLSNALLSALSITNLGLISSMVGFLLYQKHNVPSYIVGWPDKTIELHVLPAHLWTDQGHTSNGVAGYGFFLGLFGIYVALRQRNREGKGPSKTLLALAILQFLAIFFTLAALIFVIIIEDHTSGQHISLDIAVSNVPYPADSWTPETWFRAVLELPLQSDSLRDLIARKVTNMEVWRWMLIPILLVDVVAFFFSVREQIRQRKVESGFGGQQHEVPRLRPFKNRYMSRMSGDSEVVDWQRPSKA